MLTTDAHSKAHPKTALTNRRLLIQNITCLSTTPKGLAITGGADKTLRTWSVQKGTMRQLAVLEKHGAPITCCHVAPSGWAVSADKDGVVCLWKPGNP